MLPLQLSCSYFVTANDFFFLAKLYGEYRMWQSWWYFVDFLSMTRSKSECYVASSPTTELVVIFAGLKGNRPFFQSGPARITIPFVVEGRSPFFSLPHTQHYAHSTSWTSFMALLFAKIWEFQKISIIFYVSKLIIINYCKISILTCASFL